MRCVQLHVCIVVLHILGVGIEVNLGWSSISIELGLELKVAGGRERGSDKRRGGRKEEGERKVKCGYIREDLTQ